MLTTQVNLSQVWMLSNGSAKFGSGNGIDCGSFGGSSITCIWYQYQHRNAGVVSFACWRRSARVCFGQDASCNRPGLVGPRNTRSWTWPQPRSMPAIAMATSLPSVVPEGSKQGVTPPQAAADSTAVVCHTIHGKGKCFVTTLTLGYGGFHSG